VSATIETPAPDADAEREAIEAQRAQQHIDEREIEARLNAEFTEALDQCLAIVRCESSASLLLPWKAAGEMAERLRQQRQRILNLPHIWAREDRQAREAAAVAAKKAAALRVALSGPPDAPADGTEEALALHAFGMAAYADDLKDQTGQLSINMARRCGWEAMIAHYRRHTRPSVNRLQTEQHLHALGLGGWAA
jgi:hypothetical protein